MSQFFKASPIYLERLEQLRKYIVDMFNNLQHNQILMELSGTKQLEQLRIRKIHEIIQDALDGEKQRHIQTLVENNALLTSKIQELQRRSPTTQTRQNYENHLMQLTRSHNKQLEELQNYFKQLLRTSLSNLSRHLQQQHQQAMDKLEEQTGIKLKLLQDRLAKSLQDLLDKETTIKNLMESMYLKDNQLELEGLQKQLNQKNQTIIQLQAELKFKQKEVEGIKSRYDQHTNATKRVKTQHMAEDKVTPLINKNIDRISTLLSKVSSFQVSRHPSPYVSPRSGKIACNEGRFKNIQKQFQKDMVIFKENLSKNKTIRKASQVNTTDVSMFSQYQ